MVSLKLCDESVLLNWHVFWNEISGFYGVEYEAVFWDDLSCGLLEIYRIFRGVEKQ